MPDLPNIIVVYGALRSGTTMLRLMLNAHPALACHGETDFLFDHLHGTGRQARYDREGLEGDRIFGAFGLDIPDAATNGQDALAGLITQMQRGVPEATVVLMLHRGLDKLLDHLPGVKVLHMIRDPRDVARSSIGMGWAGNTYYGISHWIKTEGDWDRLAPRLPSAACMTVQYEELISSPEDTLSAVCTFAGQSYHADMLRYDDNSTYTPPDPSLAYQWKRKQSPTDIAMVEHRIGPMITARGYTLSDLPAWSPSAVQKARVWLQNKSKHWQHRIGRHGIVDPLWVAVTARLGHPKLAARAQSRIQATNITHLK